MTATPALTLLPCDDAARLPTSGQYIVPLFPTAVPEDVASPAPSHAPSTTTTQLSDGDRERMPSATLVHGVSAVIASLTAAGDSLIPRRGSRANRDDAADTKTSPTEVVEDVLQCLVGNGLLSAHALVCCVSLISRAAEACPRTVNSLTIRRTAVGCAILAVKAESDERYRLSWFSEAMGVSMEMLRATERQLFDRLGHDVSTSARAFHEAVAAIAANLPDAAAVELLASPVA